MAKHAYVAYRITVTKLRDKDELNVGNFDGRGSDLLTLFHAFLSDIASEPLQEKKYDRLLMISSLDPRGRTVHLKAKYGRFGLSGTLVNATSGEITYSYDEDESPVSETRNMLACPKNGKWAVFLAERYGGRGAASMLIGQFKRAFRSRFGSDGFIVRFEGLMDPDAWAKYVNEADMKELQIKRWGPSPDIADDLTAKSVGRIVSHVKPHRGQKSFPRAFREKITRGEIRAQEIIGIPVKDDDEVEMVLDDGQQQRSLILGETEIPILAYLLAEDTDERPADDEVRHAMLEKVSDLKARLQLALPSDWSEGEWGHKELSVKLDPVRDG